MKKNHNGGLFLGNFLEYVHFFNIFQSIVKMSHIHIYLFYAFLNQFDHQTMLLALGFLHLHKLFICRFLIIEYKNRVSILIERVIFFRNGKSFNQIENVIT